MLLPASSSVGKAVLTLRDACPAVSERNVLELLGVIGRLKNVVRLPVTDDREWSALLGHCEGLALSVARSSFRILCKRTTALGDEFTTNIPWNDPRGGSFVAYVARDQATAQHAEQIDASGDNDQLGLLYQYPPCCTKAYTAIAGGGCWVELLMARTVGSRHSAYANKLAYLFDGASFFPDYFPCALSCSETASLGHRYSNLLESYALTSLAESIRERVARPILYSRGVLHQFKNAKIEGLEIVFPREGVARYQFNEHGDLDVRSAESLHLIDEDGRLTAHYKGQSVGTLFTFATCE